MTATRRCRIPLKPRTSVQRRCELCPTSFWVEQNVMKRGYGRFCSAKCRSTGIFTPAVKAKMSANWAPREPWNKNIVFVPIAEQQRRNKATKKVWLAKNPHKPYEYILNRRARKKIGGGCFGEQDWQRMKAECSFECAFCYRAEPDIVLHRDHIMPISKGGSHTYENIQPLCQSCNSKKSNRLISFPVWS